MQHCDLIVLSNQYLLMEYLTLTNIKKINIVFDYNKLLLIKCLKLNIRCFCTLLYQNEQSLKDSSLLAR